MPLMYALERFNHFPEKILPRINSVASAQTIARAVLSQLSSIP
jgi:hypothetical protein